MLVTDSAELAKARTSRAGSADPTAAPRCHRRASVDTNGKIIVTDDMNKAIDAVNIIAPEHLEICVDDPFAVLNSVKNAGSIFLGKNVPEALGDYFAGPNHTLPTSGTARFSSPLGVDDFVKKSSFIYYTLRCPGKVQSRIAVLPSMRACTPTPRALPSVLKTSEGGIAGAEGHSFSNI